jgi:hypothetical protein
MIFLAYTDVQSLTMWKNKVQKNSITVEYIYSGFFVTKKLRGFRSPVELSSPKFASFIDKAKPHTYVGLGLILNHPTLL